MGVVPFGTVCTMAFDLGLPREDFEILMCFGQWRGFLRFQAKDFVANQAVKMQMLVTVIPGFAMLRAYRITNRLIGNHDLVD